MKLKDIKKLLNTHNLPVWKLIRVMGISRNSFYTYSHQNFKGVEDKLKHSLKKLIGGNKYE